MEAENTLIGSTHYDVIIVGAGPAGIFAAYELTRSNPRINILLIEKGKPLEERTCPSRDSNKQCYHCNPCSIMSGWGGAGAFSDGKLTLSSEVGGRLFEYVKEEELKNLIQYVDSVYLDFGAPEEVFGVDEEKVHFFQRKAAKAGLKLIPTMVRHMGTERCKEVLSQFYDYLSSRVDILTGSYVKEIITNKDRIKGVRVDSKVFDGDYVIVAPGRDGADWLIQELKRLNLDTIRNPVDVGVRVELPAVVMEELTETLYEPKLEFYSRSFDDRVRTFCMNPNGEVITEYSDGVITVNGHSYKDRKTENTNFALLISTTFTEPFKEPISYAKYIARLANLLGGGVLVQRLGDLISGRRSTEDRIKKGIVKPTLVSATPGDLSFVLPYRHLTGILEMLKALDELAPGVYSRYTLLYGVEVKFYSVRPKLNSSLETQIRNLFAVGDGAGVTRGLVQASASGVIAAREIAKRIGVEIDGSYSSNRIAMGR
ncbi:MAG: NAD(P)/FAD-dependent oxidoreductase [bacterium]